MRMTKMEAFIIRLGLTLLFSLGSLSASASAGAATPEEADVSKEASALMHKYWDWRLQEAPEFASKNGIHKYDDRLEEFTEAAFQRRKANASAMLVSIKHINQRLLTRTDRVSLSVMKDMLATFVAGYPYRKMSAYIPFRSYSSILSAWDRIQDVTSHDTLKGYHNLLARYSAIAVQAEQLMNLTRQAIELGYSWTRVGLTKPMPLTEEKLQDLALVFSGPFKNIPAFIANETSRQSLKNSGIKIITEKVIPSIEKIHRFFSEEYYPTTRVDVGVAALEGGRDFYEACLRWHLSVNISAQQVHELGLQEVERIHRQMQKIKDADNYRGDVREYIAHLKNQTTNMYSTSEEMMDSIRHIIKKIHHRLPDILLHIPAEPFLIEERSNPMGPIGSYAQAPLDGSRPAYYYVNTFKPDTRARFNTMPVVLHEAEPGHHVQAAYVDDEKLPTFRSLPDYSKFYAAPFKWPFYTAYTEGWGLYSEYLGEELELYEQSYELLGRYSGEMLRACRMVVDTGLHAFGWSQERAEAYIANYTAVPPDLIHSEVSRYISWPGQACAYKIGELKIKELRKIAVRELDKQNMLSSFKILQKNDTSPGDSFDLRHFHDRILSLGPVPLYILEDEIMAWIELQNPRALQSACAGRSRDYTLALYEIVCAIMIGSLIRGSGL